MDAALGIRLLIVVIVASLWIGFLAVLREVAKRWMVTLRVKREAHRIAEAHAVDPWRLESFLELYYGNAYVRDLGIIALGPNGTPDINGTIRLRLELMKDESSSNERLRIVPLGLKSLRDRVFEPTEPMRGSIEGIFFKVQKRNL